MERLTGVEALKNYSFRDVILKPDQALTVLNERVRSVIPGNIENLMSDFDPNNSNDVPFINRLKQAQSMPPETFFQPGGLSMSKEEFRLIYQKSGNFTFKQVLQKYINEVFPRILDDDEFNRNPGPTCVGYLLDLFKILDPQVATFSDGVQSMIEVMRESSLDFGRINPFILGSMIDDSINLRGVSDSSPDILVDKEASIKLRYLFLSFANGDEKRDFGKGLRITVDELKWENLGISLN